MKEYTTFDAVQESIAETPGKLGSIHLPPHAIVFQYRFDDKYHPRYICACDQDGNDVSTASLGAFLTPVNFTVKLPGNWLLHDSEYIYHKNGSLYTTKQPITNFVGIPNVDNPKYISIIGALDLNNRGSELEPEDVLALKERTLDKLLITHHFGKNGAPLPFPGASALPEKKK